LYPEANVMHHTHTHTHTQRHGNPARYSAKKMVKPVNFFCMAPEARSVSVVGEFNGWDPGANPMKQGPDGGWHVQVPLHHGHHQYAFVVDGEIRLDPRAQGVARNDRNERVSLMSVS
jgi:1,4-alpha-glucan branching enzyme